MTTPAHLTPEYPADADGHRDGFKWMPALGGDAFMGTSGKVRLVESSLADGPHIEVWWTDGNPSVRMHRAKEAQ